MNYEEHRNFRHGRDPAGFGAALGLGTGQVHIVAPDVTDEETVPVDGTGTITEAPGAQRVATAVQNAWLQPAVMQTSEASIAAP